MSAEQSQGPRFTDPWEERITEGRFAGKTVVVTGAGSGIGLATALRVAKEGGRAIAVDISAERLEEFASAHPDLDIVTVAADITKDEDVQRVVDTAGDVVHGLANVAGIMDGFEEIENVADTDWDRVFAVNVDGILKLTRGLIGKLEAAEGASVVNTGSEASLRGSQAGLAYTSSKHAVIGFTKQSSIAYQPKRIRFNVVAPGGVATNISPKFNSARGIEVLRTIAGPISTPIAQPAELAASITWLLSDDSPNINGVVLPSDGGLSAI